MTSSGLSRDQHHHNPENINLSRSPTHQPVSIAVNNLSLGNPTGSNGRSCPSYSPTTSSGMPSTTVQTHTVGYNKHATAASVAARYDSYIKLIPFYIRSLNMDFLHFMSNLVTYLHSILRTSNLTFYIHIWIFNSFHCSNTICQMRIVTATEMVIHIKMS